MDRRRLFRIVRRALLIGIGSVVGLLVVALLVVKILYGRGATYPDVSTPPVVASADVVSVAELELPPGNVAGSRDGRIFFNLHPLVHPYRFTDTFLFELVDGKPHPYPDLASQAELRFAFGMTVDAQNRLWLTAPATLDRKQTRVIAYDLATNTKVVDHELPPGVARFGQDLRVTPDGKTLLFADTGALRFTHGALFVVDIATWSARKVLDDDRSTEAQDWVIHTHDGPLRLVYGLVTMQGGLDGIAISADGQSVILAPMSNGVLYRVPLADVLDPRLSESELSKRVVRVGKKPLSDGIEAAPDGSVLVTDVEHGGIARVDPRGALQTLVKLEQVTWADGVFVAPGGDVYFTDSAIPAYLDPLLRPPSLGRLRARRPYHLYRFHLPPTPATK